MVTVDQCSITAPNQALYSGLNQAHRPDQWQGAGKTGSAAQTQPPRS